MRRIMFPLAIMAALIASVPVGAEEKVSGRDRFGLWNSCRPMNMVVFVGKEATDIRLTKDAIMAAVRSRLRAARLYKAGFGLPSLSVAINAYGLAFSVEVEYYKMLYDRASGQSWGAVSWDTGTLGTHGNNASYILSAVSEKLDRFIDEYLRVNDSACQLPRKSK